MLLRNDSVQLLDLDSICLQADSLALALGHLSAPRVQLKTPSSLIQAWTEMDFSAFTPGSGGHMDVGVKTTVSKADLLTAAATYLPEGFAQAYPDRPLHLALTASGNIDSLKLTRVEASLPGSIYLDAQGDMGHLLDSTGLQGTVAFNVQTQDLEWTRALAGGLQGVRLPPMSLAGTATAQGSSYGADAVLCEGNGLLHLKGDIDTGSPLTYEATLQTSQLQLRHFLPSLAAGPLTAKGTLKGAGTDLMSRSTRLDAELRLTQASYAAYDLNGRRSRRPSGLFIEQRSDGTYRKVYRKS